MSNKALSYPKIDIDLWVNWQVGCQTRQTSMPIRFRELPISVDNETSAHAMREILSIGREQGLSSYDAAYLELAMRHGLALATLDNALRKAAKKSGVKL